MLCYKCGQDVDTTDLNSYQYSSEVWFHEFCFNPYEHYYGLGKPLD